MPFGWLKPMTSLWLYCRVQSFLMPEPASVLTLCGRSKSVVVVVPIFTSCNVHTLPVSFTASEAPNRDSAN
ncbi:MAG: hypothetical protein IIT37_04195, partial [Bacteroidales bacterium]|nr:hypothetical protein [Bacteroidales bacterium]